MSKNKVIILCVVGAVVLSGIIYTAQGQSHYIGTAHHDVLLNCLDKAEYMYYVTQDAVYDYKHHAPVEQQFGQDVHTIPYPKLVYDTALEITNKTVIQDVTTCIMQFREAVDKAGWFYE